MCSNLAKLLQCVLRAGSMLGVAMLGIACTIVSPRTNLEIPKLDRHELASIPIPCVETGNHSNIITRLSTDNENQYLVTSSNDKTVRVWEMGSGRLLKVLRPPIDEGKDGMLYAVAIAPNGKTIACGGWTGLDWQEHSSIYIFDRDSGKMIQKIQGMPNVIYDLAYSKYGRFLVATYGGKCGVCIYRTSDYSLVAMDTRYQAPCISADFNINDTLVTASYDGFIRLYDSNFKLVTKQSTRDGKRPYRVRFAPDGMEIAVGFAESPQVDVLSGKDLEYLYSPDTKGIGNGDVASIAWSAFGKSLYAGGTYRGADGKYVIRKWTRRGKGSYVDLVAGDNTIQDILTLKDEGIAFTTSAPLLGAFDLYDQRKVYQEPFIADFHEIGAGFLVSADGTTFQFSYEKGKSPATFSIVNRVLTAQASRDKNLQPPQTATTAFRLTDWENHGQPKYNDIPLALAPYEISRCVAIGPDASNFLLGTDQYLRLFDKLGQEVWKVPTFAIAWGVNIAANGKVALAAFSDGTIRWYRMNDGKELLAFFPHKDKKLWVMWSKSGYFDASPGGDKLIGWHQNSSSGEAGDFFPISRIYYRPDVAPEILENLDEDKAVEIANSKSGRKVEDVDISRMLPPMLTIVSPEPDTEVSTNEVLVQFSVRNPSGEPITNVKAMIDGRPSPQQRAIKLVQRGKDASKIKVMIPPRDCTISIMASSKYIMSEPASVRVKWAGEAFLIKPKLYILAIGVSKYKDTNISLAFAAKDAQDLTETMQRQKGLLYDDVNARLLMDEGATREQILDGFDWIRKQTTDHDVAMVFLAGHGINDSNGVYYYLPVDAEVDRLLQTCIPFSVVKDSVASLPGKALFFVDTCHSGNVMGGKRRALVDITGVVNELASAENGAVVFASSTGSQYSLENNKWGNGAFTKALIEGLSGKADYVGKKRITVNMLDLYLSERVKELTDGEQTPTTTKPQTVPDFPVSIVR